MPKKTSATAVKAAPIAAIKGFNRDLTCRDYQFRVGETFKSDSKPVRCGEGGFHAIEGHPLEVFGYYPPATSVYHEVLCAGSIARDDTDSKIACAEITIRAEVKLPDLVARAVKWVFDRADWQNGPVATGKNEGATASGTRGAATASGDQGAATASGYAGKVRGAAGNALFLVERGDDFEIVAVWAGIAGRDGIEADTYYILRDGKPVKIED